MELLFQASRTSPILHEATVCVDAELRNLRGENERLKREVEASPRCEREFYTPEEMAKSIREAQQEAPPVDPILRAPKRPPTGSTYVTGEEAAMSPRLSVFVAGVPAPQGSKRHVGGGRMVESSKAVGPWRERIAAELATLELEPTRNALVLELTFTFARPKSHFRSGGGLKDSAPRVPVTRPDLDKLVRAALDAMTGVLFVDDSQVTGIEAAKYYANRPGLLIVWRTPRT